MRWALLLALLSTSALASRADRLSVSPRLDRRDRLGASSAANPILLSLSLLPPDSECSGTPPDGVTFTRASSATCINSSGVAYNLTSNQARAHATLGLLVEGTSTNALLRSRATSTVPWSCPTCGATTLGMDGATSVPTIGVGTASQAITPAAGSRIVSVYVRNAGGVGCSVTLSADAETTGAVSVFDLGSWQRVSLTYTSDAAVTVSLAVSGGSCTAVAADYWQDEAGSIATSPVVSAGTAATRAGDVVNVPDPGLSTTIGCAAIDVAPLFSTVSGVNGGYYLSAAGGSNSRIGYNTASGNQWRVFDGVSPVFVAGGYVAGTPKRYRTEWEPGRVQAFNVADAIDGAPGSFVAFGTTFSGGLDVGHSGSSSQAFAHLRSLVLGSTPEACR